MRRFAGLLTVLALVLGVAISFRAGAADPPPGPPSGPPSAPLAATVAPPAAAAPAGGTAQLVPPGGFHGGALYQMHASMGLNCASCHKESPPTTPVSTAMCQSCHGTYQELAAKTDGLAGGLPNPHASHQGDLPCESCHHIHKASENFCANCHQNFNFTVP